MLPKSKHTGTSKFRGVSYNERLKKWQAGIKVNGRSINLGVFKSEIVAAENYNIAALKHFGEHAYQNLLRPISKNRRRR